MSGAEKIWWRIDGRIVERTPEHLAVAHVHEQAVAVVDFGAVIVELALGIFAEPEHARQRREADGFDRLRVRVGGENLCSVSRKYKTASMSATVVSPGRM